METLKTQERLFNGLMASLFILSAGLVSYVLLSSWAWIGATVGVVGGLASIILSVGMLANAYSVLSETVNECVSVIEEQQNKIEKWYNDLSSEDQDEARAMYSTVTSFGNSAITKFQSLEEDEEDEKQNTT